MSTQGLNIFIACLAAVLIASSTADDEFPLEGGRIVGGQLTTIDKLPYLVQLRDYEDHFFCGGTLVSPRHVISAAHCLKFCHYNDIVIVAGATYNDETGVKSTIAASYTHPNYDIDNPSPNHDIVVFKLAKPLTGKNIKPLNLCSRRWKAGETIQVSGWGHTTDNGQSSHQVRTVFMPIFPWDECSRRIGHDKIFKSTMCAGTLGRKDACQGDSGGPGVVNNELCGVVSWGGQCGSKKYPGVYTNINYVRKWIDKVMQY